MKDSNIMKNYLTPVVYTMFLNAIYETVLRYCKCNVAYSFVFGHFSLIIIFYHYYCGWFNISLLIV